MQIKTETRVGIFVIIAIIIFFIMTMQLGVFRLDRGKYRLQIVYFNDVSGLEKKAEVKIAGVKVGWVEKIDLIADDTYQAKAYVMILKNYVLHADAYAVVKQEGLLGTKYLEIIPGDPLLPKLQPGQAFDRPGRSPVSMDEILHKVNKIATNVEDVTGALKETFGGIEGKEELKSTMENVREAAEKLAAISSVIDRTLSENEGNINTILHDVGEFAHDMKEGIPAISADFNRVANQLEITTQALEDAAREAKDGFKSIGSVAEKIDEGKGLIGKLINEEETYEDLKVAVGGLKKYFAKIDRIQIVLDSHGEYMYRPAERITVEDSKGYFDIRIHPNDDYFYILQVVSTVKGNIKRQSMFRNWFDEKGDEILSSEFFVPGRNIPELIGTVNTTWRDFDAFKFGLQAAKLFKNIAIRFGMIESSVGIGIDINIPFGTDKFRWITTLEIFDWRGRDRIDDGRPHFKWINRLFLLRNFYWAFGADDFISKDNANAFFGAGLRFSDDDLKYLASSLGVAAIGVVA